MQPDESLSLKVKRLPRKPSSDFFLVLKSPYTINTDNMEVARGH